LRRRFALLLALAWLPLAASAEETITATALPLAPNIGAGARVGSLVFRGAVELRSRDSRFGGWSGLHVDAAGHATAASDAGYFAEFDLVEDRAGTLAGVRNGLLQTMTGPGGARLVRKRDRDAEELVVLPDGTRLVIFEHNVRIGIFPKGSAEARSWIPLPNLVPSGNQGIEAAVRFADGSFLLIAERLGEAEGVRRAWLGEPGRWQPLDYVPPTNDDVSGAALLPGGDLLVLERSATVLGGFRSRLVRVPAAQLRPGARLAGSEILRLAPPYLSDNFEGVSVRETGGGAAIYLISDDNYFVLQRTLLLKFELPGTVSPGRPTASGPPLPAASAR
jgi:hypothetical protein